MSVHLQVDLDQVHQHLLTLGETVQTMVAKAVRALSERDAALARAVIQTEDEVDRQENALEEECLRIVALHQPVAIDLRRVAATVKINTDLERMADLAVNIAEDVLILTQAPTFTMPPLFETMAQLTNIMVQQCLEAFVTSNTVLARRVCRQDDEVDRCNREIIDQLIPFLQASDDKARIGLRLFNVARDLERIADHATNVAEDVVFLVEGESIRHHPEAL